jgi:hypothetical protein
MRYLIAACGLFFCTGIFAQFEDVTITTTQVSGSVYRSHLQQPPGPHLEDLP